MATILKNSVWVYAPKTGSTFADAALRDCANADTFRLGSTHWMFHELPPKIRRGRKAVTIVRHPIAWYRSYYASRIRAKRKGVGTGFRQRLIAEVGHPLEMHRRFAQVMNATFHASNSFADFADRITDDHPGILSAMFRAFSAPCGFVCRNETLVKDMIEALRRNGEAAVLPRLYSTPPRNQSSQLPDCSHAVEQLIMESERYTIERWY